jgi:methyltransferase FkbM-like protein
MLKKFIKDAAFAVGVTLSRRTKSADVLDLITRLKPQDCGKDLIRIGGNGDGGYLIPDDLGGIEYCFSAGVGAVVDFESHLATLNIRSFLADYSIDSRLIERPEFTFDRKFLGANDTQVFFTLKSWRDKYLKDYTGDLLLQMDIEGFEYEVLIGTPIEVLSDFRIMVIEFHHLEKMFDPFIHSLYKTCFEKILKHFHVAHIHPNNCCGSVRKGEIEVPRALEFTFYNNSRVSRTTYKQEFPHPLDRDNVAANKSLRLPKCWYK